MLSKESQGLIMFVTQAILLTCIFLGFFMAVWFLPGPNILLRVIISCAALPTMYDTFFVSIYSRFILWKQSIKGSGWDKGLSKP